MADETYRFRLDPLPWNEIKFFEFEDSAPVTMEIAVHHCSPTVQVMVNEDPPIYRFICECVAMLEGII